MKESVSLFCLLSALFHETPVQQFPYCIVELVGPMKVLTDV